MVNLYAGKKKSFEYTGCNNQVTVEQLRRYLRYNAITMGPNVRKKDLCHTIDALLKAEDTAKQDELPILVWYTKETMSEMKKRLRGSSPQTLKQQIELKKLVLPSKGKKKTFFQRLFGL